MNEQLLLLIDLQKIDSGLDRILIQKRELPERRSALEQGLQKATEKFDLEKQHLEDVKKAHRQKEDHLKKGIEALKKTKDRLLEVKTNKEYQAMLKEIETIEKLNSDCEDEILVALEEIDKTQKEIGSAEKELAACRCIFDSGIALIDKDIQALDESLQALQKDKEVMLSRIRADLVKRYETIKSKRSGCAVAAISSKGICEGCHMTIPPQLCIDLQKLNDLFQCPFCSRIIYWGNDHHD